jgi:hypothetical protein
MNLSLLLEHQVRIQAEAITLWKRWMVGQILGGVLLLISAQLLTIGGPESAGIIKDIVKFGGAVVSLLAGLPYREIVPRKERLATYSFLLERLRLLDSLSSRDQADLLSLANDALKETLKR